jgi:hypothetical protein
MSVQPAQPAQPDLLAPPPGPGVQPPFVAPPTDGARQRRWLAWGLASGAALLLCVGGLLGLGGLVVFGTQMIVDQSRAAVTEHLTAVQNGEYEAAYDRLCDSTRSRVSKDAYRRSLEAEPGITSFTVNDPIITDQIIVPTEVSYEDGTAATVRFLLEQDTSTGEFEVCGEED